MKLPAEEAKALLSQAIAKGKFDFQCCFCKQSVDSPVNALLLISGWDGPEEEQKSQQWFCHTSCFERLTNETAP